MEARRTCGYWTLTCSSVGPHTAPGSHQLLLQVRICCCCLCVCVNMHIVSFGFCVVRFVLDDMMMMICLRLEHLLLVTWEESLWLLHADVSQSDEKVFCFVLWHILSPALVKCFIRIWYLGFYCCYEFQWLALCLILFHSAALVCDWRILPAVSHCVECAFCVAAVNLIYIMLHLYIFFLALLHCSSSYSDVTLLQMLTDVYVHLCAHSIHSTFFIIIFFLIFFLNLGIWLATNLAEAAEVYRNEWDGDGGTRADSDDLWLFFFFNWQFWKLWNLSFTTWA